MTFRAIMLALCAAVAATGSSALSSDENERGDEVATDMLAAIARQYEFEGEIALSPSQYKFHSLIHSVQTEGALSSPKTGDSGNEPANVTPPAPPVPAIGEPRWPWASVTKQVIAVLVMQQVEAGTIKLDRPASRYLPALRKGSPTIRQLLQHQSGLRNPDDSPMDANGFPSFYTTGPTGLDWCVANRNEPGGAWRYNNCDYMVLGAVLEKVTQTSLAELIDREIGEKIGWQDTALLTAADPSGYRGRNVEYDTLIAGYGASAGLVGSLRDMLRFDRAFFGSTSTTRPIFSKESRDIMWMSDPALGYMALGQWVFEAPISGCGGAVTIVERRGAIGKYQIRNIILPESKMVLALASDKEGFDFGEIWTGSGFMHDVLSEVACR